MNTLEILKAGRELISDPARWTRGYMARDASGQCVDANALAAICFCSLGAIRRVTKDSETEEKACSALRAVMQCRWISEWNDESDHAEILAGWDAAIAKLEAA